MSTSAESSSVRRLEIKKYANRRYYDATQSCHLTLDEIRSLVQRGCDLRVLDARTNKDITAQVLTQIILELDTPKLDSLPVPLLVRIIRMNDQLVKEFVDKYFNQALQSFLEYQQQVEEQLRRSPGVPAVFPSVSAWTKAMLEPFATAFGSAAGRPPRPDAASAPAPAGRIEPSDLQRMVRELQEQVADLKRAQESSGSKKPPARRTGKG